MNAVDFVNKVREMRATQKAWFKDHLRADLIKSKQLEAEVDKALREGVTVYATATLDVTEGTRQLGLIENGSDNAENWTFGVAPWLDAPADQRPTDGEGEQA